MPESVASPLAAWENFYVIIGSAAAALTGLMFVVIALISDAEPGTSSPGLGAFATPTVVHFCAALLVSAILSDFRKNRTKLRPKASAAFASVAEKYW